MTKLRFAMLGCGKIADVHAAALLEREDVEIVAAADPLSSMREKARTEWNCAVFEDEKELLRETEVDAACVCAPPARHPGLVAAMLDSGAHVLCEKPLAIRLNEARAMAEHARRVGRVLMASAKFRFVAELVETRRRIEAGRIGRPLLYEVNFCARIPVGGQWKIKPELAGGGVVMDNAPHAFDVLSMLLPDRISELAAMFGPRTITPEVEDTALVLFRGEDGTAGRVALSWSYFTRDLDYAIVQGTQAGLRVGWDGGRMRRRGDVEWNPFGRPYDKREAFRSQMNAFVERIQKGEVAGAALEGLRAVAFTEAIYRSAAGSDWISVESVTSAYQAPVG